MAKKDPIKARLSELQTTVSIVKKADLERGPEDRNETARVLQEEAEESLSNTKSR
jgi:hypothetical protein